MTHPARTVFGKVCGAALAVALAVGPAAGAGEFSAGPWRGMAFFENAEFVNCGMVGRGGLATLMFTLTAAGELKLGVHQSGMRYTPGNTFPGSLSINGGPANARTFIAGKRNVLVAAMGPLNEAKAALSQAQKLRLRVADLAQDFEIESLSDALGKLAVCVQKRGRG